MERGDGWNALFWCNHDQPRIVSRLGSEGKYWKESAKMLAGMIHFMRGTPYIYQGEEIGMTNPHYTSIEQYKDVESLNYYKILLQEGKTSAQALKILAARSRDNSRTPMQWTESKNCGFSQAEPWLSVSDNISKINVSSQQKDESSILSFYKKLIVLRKEKKLISKGKIEFLENENKNVLAYKRTWADKGLVVCCNLRETESRMDMDCRWKDYKKVIGNYNNELPCVQDNKITLQPYEFLVLEGNE